MKYIARRAIRFLNPLLVIALLAFAPQRFSEIVTASEFAAPTSNAGRQNFNDSENLFAVFGANFDAVNAAPTVVITVNTVSDTTANDGLCTLREAIIAANTNTASGAAAGECAAGTVGADTINFNIAGAGVKTIAPTSSLPEIIEAVTINGYTQPLSAANTNPTTLGINAVPLVELSGASAGAGVDGLRLASSGSTVRGLIINRFASDGISLVANSDSNVIAGNFIGTDATGTIDLGNASHGISTDVGSVFSVPDFNIVGGTNPADRNLISGNNQDGMNLFFAVSTNIRGNIIGLAKNGADVLGNGDDGIDALNGSDEIIGGTSAAARNIISGNGAAGIAINDNTTVQGNYIGTDASGTLDRGNNSHGIRTNVSFNNLIGGTSAGAGNLISGNNANGIFVGNSGNNIIQGNLIGTQANGTSQLGNSGKGIELFAGSTNNNTIGGSANGAANTIAFNGEDGIEIQSGTGNLISRNSIYSNGTTNLHLGIDLLGTDGLTENDPDDPDTGVNNLQNYPVITSASQSGSRVIGILNSTPSTSFRLEFFNGSTASNSGKTFVGAFDVTTDANGDAAFDQTFASNAPVGSFVTATATRNVAPFDTSEFSYAKQVAPLPTAASVTIGGRISTTSGRGISGARVAITEAGGNVRYATTNPFGYYRFAELASGQTVVVSVGAKNFVFAPNTRTFNITEDLTNADFTGVNK